RERKRSAAQQRKEGGSDRMREREKEIECLTVLWRSREVSAGTATVRRGEPRMRSGRGRSQRGWGRSQEPRMRSGRGRSRRGRSQEPRMRSGRGAEPTRTGGGARSRACA
ncbi:unnamed protein product, partial [Bubo scandiacus]